ncbi:MAG: tripartite tricarboxylate transporter substrate binding protein [Symploca sp. SIO2C1]|nr:tripartite tricarboxylate transporter substrate binding protein [Symploca sp. SIO2C1]
MSLLGCQAQELTTTSNTQRKNLECIAPAKPGGGFDLTCRLAANSLKEAQLIEQPMLVKYLPGGIGAIAYNNIVGSRNQDSNVIVAASTGSALNLAQGKFGEYDENAVRWLAALGADFGVIVVNADSPWQNLDDLMQAWKKNPESVVIAGGGYIGAQDWMKASLLAKAAGIDPKQMRFVAYEGGGEALASVLGGQTQLCPCDRSEMKGQLESGKFRVLAVLADERLPDEFAQYPTAKEQGYDVTWPIWRGYYLPPDITEAEYQWWVDTITKLVETPEFKQELANRGLFPYIKIGEEYETMVKQQVKDFRESIKEVGLAE